jgi:hypothetical protein
MRLKFYIANFHENFEMCLNAQYCEENEAIYTLSMALTTNVNHQKEIRLTYKFKLDCEKSYCNLHLSLSIPLPGTNQYWCHMKIWNTSCKQ